MTIVFHYSTNKIPKYFIQHVRYKHAKFYDKFKYLYETVGARHDFSLTTWTSKKVEDRVKATENT